MAGLLSRKWILLGAAVVAAAAAAWLLAGGSSGGAGRYSAELASCQDRINGDAQWPAFIEFVDGTVWVKGDAERLEIGGKVRLLNGAGRPTGFAYACVVRKGQVVQANLT